MTVFWTIYSAGFIATFIALWLLCETEIYGDEEPTWREFAIFATFQLFILGVLAIFWPVIAAVMLRNYLDGRNE